MAAHPAAHPATDPAAQPDDAEAWMTRARELLAAGRHLEAFEATEQAAARDADAEPPMLQFEAAWKALYDSVNRCDWRRHEDLQRSVVAHIGRGRAFVGETTLASPLLDARTQLATARNYYRPHAATPQAFVHRPPGARIRIGLVGADFHQQATAYLLTGVIEQFDRRRFDLIAYDYGKDDGGALRRRCQAAYDRLVPIHDLSDRDAASLIHGDGIDVLLHLRGLANGRIGLFAHRPAAIQIHYLYYPGTSGAACMDYIVADDYVIPPGHESFYAERVLRLPGCYQPNDSRRALPSARDRASFGLPADAVVLGNFGQHYKLTPELFAAWCGLLAADASRLLWLLGDDAAVQANLRRAAEAHGISGGRLVFSPPLGASDHLARLRACDLLLDTFPYGGHTLTSDALWAGTPVVTRSGDSFASRVAGSLLRAVGLEQLVARSAEEYRHIAEALLKDRPRLEAIRGTLTAQRHQLALFDSAAYARKLEAALLGVVAARWQQG